MATYLKEAKPKPKEDLTAVRETVRQIIEKVRTEGEAGVRYYSEKFDKWSPPSFKLGEQEIRDVKKQLPQSMVEDIEFCQTQIRNFAQAQMDTLNDMEVETIPGVHLGQKIIPITKQADPMCRAGVTPCWPRRT